MPPHLAGRDTETQEFERILEQEVVFENLILTGLRGVGKTVLLETFKPLAISRGWLWVGTDLSESSSMTEENLALRLLTDLSVVTSSITVEVENPTLGFRGEKGVVSFGIDTLTAIYGTSPGLVSDKLKAVLTNIGDLIKDKTKGIVFAYDEAQILADHAKEKQFPMSLMLDVFQSLQKQGYPFLLALTGLPTLFPKLVEARTYAERMFRVVRLDRLSPDDSRDAIVKPMNKLDCPFAWSEDSISVIVNNSGGYPYFIQFICREAFDVFVQKTSQGEQATVPIEEIVRKLDTDFFVGRWARATDRQRELMTVVARLDSCEEFSVQDVVEKSKELLVKSFGSSNVNQMLNALTTSGLIYKNRHGRYSFAVPLLEKFIRRQS